MEDLNLNILAKNKNVIIEKCNNMPPEDEKEIAYCLKTKMSNSDLGEEYKIVINMKMAKQIWSNSWVKKDLKFDQFVDCLVLHEFGHINYSFKNIKMSNNTKKDKLKAHISNIIEDARIEYQMSMDYPTFAKYFNILAEIVRTELKTQGMDKATEDTIKMAVKCVFWFARYGIILPESDSIFMGHVIPLVLIAKRSVDGSVADKAADIIYNLIINAKDMNKDSQEQPNKQDGQNKQEGQNSNEQNKQNNPTPQENKPNDGNQEQQPPESNPPPPKENEDNNKNESTEGDGKQDSKDDSTGSDPSKSNQESNPDESQPDPPEPNKNFNLDKNIKNSKKIETELAPITKADMEAIEKELDNDDLSKELFKMKKNNVSIGDQPGVHNKERSSFFLKTANEHKKEIENIRNLFMQTFTERKLAKSYEGEINLKRQQNAYMNSITGDEAKDYTFSKFNKVLIDVVLLRDISGSTDSMSLDYAKAIIIILSALEQIEGIRTAQIDFETYARENKSFDGVLDNSSIIPTAEGGTDIIPALKKLALYEFKGKRNLLFLISDGQWSDERQVETMLSKIEKDNQLKTIRLGIGGYSKNGFTSIKHVTELPRVMADIIIKEVMVNV